MVGSCTKKPLLQNITDAGPLYGAAAAFVGGAVGAVCWNAATARDDELIPCFTNHRGQAGWICNPTLRKLLPRFCNFEPLGALDIRGGGLTHKAPDGPMSAH